VSETLVVVNPAAGGGRAGLFWERLAPQAARVTAFEVVSANSAEGSRRAVEEAVAQGCQRVVAVGGDGTAHLVANVLLAPALIWRGR
jgi:diacylglycerol kinase family enzyme